jgi:bacillithiol system protein YtxJ
VTRVALLLLTTLEDLDAAVAASEGRPLLLFKHSLTCGASAHAREEVEAFLSAPAPPADAWVVHVQTGRAISSAIADRFGIRHESPQVLLISKGKVVWHASHYGITRREIAAAVERHLPTAMPGVSQPGPR